MLAVNKLMYTFHSLRQQGRSENGEGSVKEALIDGKTGTKQTMVPFDARKKRSLSFWKPPFLFILFIPNVDHDIPRSYLLKMKFSVQYLTFPNS